MLLFLRNMAIQLLFTMVWYPARIFQISVTGQIKITDILSNPRIFLSYPNKIALNLLKIEVLHNQIFYITSTLKFFRKGKIKVNLEAGIFIDRGMMNKDDKVHRYHSNNKK